MDGLSITVVEVCCIIVQVPRPVHIRSAFAAINRIESRWRTHLADGLILVHVGRRAVVPVVVKRRRRAVHRVHVERDAKLHTAGRRLIAHSTVSTRQHAGAQLAHALVLRDGVYALIVSRSILVI